MFKKIGYAVTSRGYICKCDALTLSLVARLMVCNRTNFSARTDLLLPTYYNETGYFVDPMTIRGSLTKPVSLTPAPIPAPPNTDTPNCLANSQHPYNPIWTVTRFFYQATKRGIDNHPLAAEWNGVLFPYNRTLEIELRNEANGFIQSCAFNDPILDNVTDRWWPCSYAKNPHAFPQRAIETFVQFNRDTGEFKVNQTWYCNDTQLPTPYAPFFGLNAPLCQTPTTNTEGLLAT